MSKHASMLGLPMVVALSFLPMIGAGQGYDELSAEQQQLQQADTQLNQNYHTASGQLDPAGQTSLKLMQRSWIVFKEADFGIYSGLSRSANDAILPVAYQVNEERDQAESLTMLGKPSRPASDFPPNEISTSQAADQELNSFYRQLMGVLPADTALAEKTAQASWIRFRDLYCQLDASLKGGVPDDGVLRDITHRRAVQFKRYISMLVKVQLPAPEGDQGPGEAIVDEKPTDPPPANPFRFAK